MGRVVTGRLPAVIINLMESFRKSGAGRIAVISSAGPTATQAQRRTEGLDLQCPGGGRHDGSGRAARPRSDAIRQRRRLRAAQDALWQRDR